MPHWRPAISCGLGPAVHVSSCWHITFFYHQNNCLTATKHFFMSTFKQSRLPTHNSNVSQNCWGKQHKCSKDNLGWLSNHTPETSLVSNMTSNKLVAKDNRNWSGTGKFFESLNLPTPKKRNITGWKQMGQFFVLGNAIDGSPPNFKMELGHLWICPCMSQAVYLKVVFQLASNFRIDHSISHGSESILFMYWSRCLFLWMV